MLERGVNPVPTDEKSKMTDFICFDTLGGACSAVVRKQHMVSGVMQNDPESEAATGTPGTVAGNTDHV